MSNAIILSVLILASLANGFVGLLVLLRNSKQTLNRIFFLLSMAVTGWTLTNAFFQVVESNHAKYVVALASYGFAALLALMFYLFCVTMARKHYAEKPTVENVLTVVGLANVGLSVIPGVIANGVSDGQIITNGSWLGAYGAVLVVMLVRGLYCLVRARRLSPPRERNATNVILVAFALAICIGVFFNLALPLMDIYAYVALGPTGSLVLVYGSAYAIIRHKLFDVRLIIARSIAYAATLLAFAAVYGFVVFGIAKLVFHINLSFAFQILLSLATGVAALSFHYFKTAFDRVTNRLFYRDAYDPEELFDAYNKAVVSTIDLDLLLKRTSTVIRDHLKTEYCLIGVKDDSNNEYRIVGTDQVAFDPADIAAVRKVTPHLHQTVIDPDDLSQGHEGIQRLLRKYNIALLVRLTSNVHTVQEGLGYMAFGPKKSGNPYTTQDIKIIEALANELIIALQNALRFEEIERFNETLQQQVEQATHKLRQTNKKLKQMDQTKDDFISMTSHQLRTPLTSIKGYISLVMDGDAGQVSETQRKLLAQAFGSAQKMVYLVADLLNVSRLKTGKFVIERVPSDLSKVITEEIGQLKEEAEMRSVSLDYKAPANFPVLQLDETKTRQVIMNFLDNAIYYTPSGGHIKAELKELPESVEFRVIDDGIGVPKADRHHLFTKFYRAKNAQRARPDGTGLGLYMASKVVIAQGGAIIFDSKEGQGSTFGFKFPKKMPEGQVPFPAQVEE